MISLRIAKEKKPHNIAERLILPCCKDIVVEQIKTSCHENFAIQVDESTDVANCAQLIIFARYVYDGDFKEEFLFSYLLESTTKGEDIFQAISTFFENVGLSWNNVCCCTTDGAPAMLGFHSGFRGQVRLANEKTKHLHCMLHRYALAAKTLPSDLRYVLDDVVHIVNYIKKSALHSRIFRLICEEFERDDKTLLFHTEVRWLSRGNILARVFFLRNELSEYFNRENNSKSSEFISKLMDSSWLSKLAYLRDVFSRINLLNKSLQGRRETVVDFVDKIKFVSFLILTISAFVMKLQLWKEKVKLNNFTMFESFEEESVKIDAVETKKIIDLIYAHLTYLQKEVNKYFPELRNIDLKLIRTPFDVDPRLVDENIQEAFIDMVNNSNAKDLYEKLPLSRFWCKMCYFYPSYVIYLLAILALIVSFLCLYFLNNNEVCAFWTKIENYVKDMFNNYEHSSPEIDFWHRTLKCCGSYSPNDPFTNIPSSCNSKDETFYTVIEI
ncbi:zinc finger BED domain-containing protein 5-like [Octopus sinensis]|uniref:Zinc finger BED domain-containing protein 5-like n=1 Tax=Octopus sinensis TaxID=2607531 RepID=A0A7E6EHD6_9MOLL|nr:zinc finger BED domain-containing protein 5-like [Octopus sinensis]